MGTGPEDLQALCQELLDACVDALDTIPTFAPGLGGAPERSYVSPGQSADDCCPQLTVWAQVLSDSPNAPGLSTGKSAAQVTLVSLVARITRCVNGDFKPPVEDMEAASAQVNADGWALRNHLYGMWKADLLFSMCGEVFWDGLRAMTPSGGCVGWNLALRVELDGYESP